MRSKFGRWMDDPEFCFPILLSPDSLLTKLVILDAHEKLSHSGCYAVLSTLRKQFFVPKFFSTTRKILKLCVTCRRFNQRPMKLNQSSYRDFRACPISVPYMNIFLDYLGPINVKINDQKTKVWVLCITCLWSRAVSLIVCPDLSVKSFLRALQVHVFREGLPSKIFSDLGSQITAGAAVISPFLDNPETASYLSEYGIKSVKFDQYYKGDSSLGSLVEICVKFTKRLIFGSIRNNVLDFHDFSLVIEQTSHILNKRPVAFKENLRDDNEHAPAALTPELLCRGRELLALNVIPAVQPDSEEWSPAMRSADALREQFSKLKSVRENLIRTYDSEFRQILISQAVNSRSRYKPVPHSPLKIGDIVLIKDPHFKANHYPMAIVKEVQVNDQNETTGAILWKGSTKESVKRHASCIIPLLRSESIDSPSVSQIADNDANLSPRRAIKRKAAIRATAKTKALFESDVA